MQTGSAKAWHNYIVTLMYKGQQSFTTSDELLKKVDRKFSDMDKRTTQSLKIRTIQQGERSADEHVQEFEKAALEAGYEGYPLVVKFKCSLNSGLRRRLVELWPIPMTIIMGPYVRPTQSSFLSPSLLLFPHTSHCYTYVTIPRNAQFHIHLCLLLFGFPTTYTARCATSFPNDNILCHW